VVTLAGCVRGAPLRPSLAIDRLQKGIVMRILSSLVTPHPKRRTWAARLAATLLLGAWACSGDGGPTAEPAAQTQRVSAAIAIAVDGVAPAMRPEPSPPGAASLVLASDYTHLDIARLRIDVLEAATNTPLYLNIDLARVGGAWTGTIPFLPANLPLTFAARAFRGSGANAEEIFAGQTQQALSADGQTITIALGSVDSGSFTPLPKIEKITVPKGLASGKSADIRFQVRGNTGEHLSYTITRESPTAGEFFVANGALTLNSDVGTFVSLYTAPTVSQSTPFTHTVAVTNGAGNTVSTAFKTNVLSPTDGVDNTGVEVLFHPVINALDASRLLGTGNVFWGARVSDDKPLDQLTYAWSFVPGGTFSPAPGFVDAAGSPTPTGNAATLANYTPSVTGELTLAVTDGDGGTTTVKVGLAPNQFPDDPVHEESLTGLKSLSAGGGYTCALFHAGNVRCFGGATYGQLGYGNQNHIGDDELPYTAGDVPIGGKAAQVATGGSHTCAVLDNGLVRCWGLNIYGQLGYGNTQNVGDDEAITSAGYVNLGGAATKVAAGLWHTCALMATGKVRCWGNNEYGQLGYGINTGSYASIGDDEAPFAAGDVDLGAGVTAKDITAGGRFTCALLTDGDVKCWGNNPFHELGYGYNPTIQIGDDETPASVGTLNLGGPVAQIDAGTMHACALLTTGSVRCWGRDEEGQLGYGSHNGVGIPARPVDVDLGGPASHISVGGDHTCAILTNGELKCWGFNFFGQLGLGSTGGHHFAPGAPLALGGNTPLQVATGYSHTCALLANGHAWCWGGGGGGQLGYGTTGIFLLPTSGGNISIATP
jgi:alpha-tubulin suppressor-like RCC1 family protein